MKFPATAASSNKSNPEVVSLLRAYSRISGVIAFTIGSIVLYGWMFDISILKSFHPTLVSMKANTAIAIILAGISLWLFHSPRKSSFNIFIVSFCAALVSALGLITITEYVTGWNLGIDQIFFTEPIGTIGTYIPGRMALNTAFCFSCLGISLLLACSKSPALFSYSQIFNLFSAFVTITALIGYFYGINEFYGYSYFTKMAVHTAFALLVISIGIMCAVPDRGIMVIISGNDFGGFLARRLLPTSIIIPILIGWLRLEGERHQFFGTAFGVLLVAVIYIVLFMLLVWEVARSLNRFDAERKRAEDLLRESEDRFDKFMENLPAIAFMKDNESRLLFANPTLKNLFGWQEAVGKLTSELLPPELAQQMISDDKRIMEIGPEIVHEKVKDINGVEHLFETHKFPFYKKNGEVLLGGISIDETERRQAEETIKMNEARLESLLKISQHKTESKQELLDYALSEAITLTKSKIGYIYFYNDVKREFVLNSWSKDVMKECKITEQQTIYQLEKTGLWGEAVRQRKPIIVNDFHAPNPLKKGYPEGHAPLLKYLTIPVFSDDRIVAVVAVANKENDYNDADIRQLTLLMDSVWQISERKRVEEELHKLSRAVEQSPASIVITNTRGEIEYVNPKFVQVTEYSFEEVLGKNPRLLKSGDKPVEEYRKLWDTIIAGNEWRGEFHNKKKNGDLYWEFAVISPIKDSQGVITHFLAVKEDITRRKEVEAEREKLIIELQTALADVKMLSGLLPICSSCKKIRDDNGYWQQVEGYIQKHSEAKFTHGICPDCMQKLYPEFVADKTKGSNKK